MMDLISVQHAKWMAIRLRRCLGFHNRTLEESKGKLICNRPKARNMIDPSKARRENSCASVHCLKFEPAVWLASTSREKERACHTCKRVEEAGCEARGETVRKPVAPEGDSKHAGRIKLDAKRERRVARRQQRALCACRHGEF